jgi:hypothetical protein
MARIFDIGEERAPDYIIIMITNCTPPGSPDTPKTEGLKTLFTDLIKDQPGKYEQAVSASMFQQITFTFVRASLMQHVQKVENSSVSWDKNRGALVPVPFPLCRSRKSSRRAKRSASSMRSCHLIARRPASTRSTRRHSGRKNRYNLPP